MSSRITGETSATRSFAACVAASTLHSTSRTSALRSSTPTAERSYRGRRLRQRDKGLPGARGCGRPGALARRPRGRDLRSRRAVRRRQDDGPQARQPLDPAHERRHSHRRHLDPRPRRRRAAALDRIRHPAGRAVPALHGGSEHRRRAAPATASHARGPKPARRSCSNSSASTRRYAKRLPGAAVGRRAPARRSGARARSEPAAAC